jgi:hypothetical protein
VLFIYSGRQFAFNFQDRVSSGTSKTERSGLIRICFEMTRQFMKIEDTLKASCLPEKMNHMQQVYWLYTVLFINIGRLLAFSSKTRCFRVGSVLKWHAAPELN